ncbi:hypothetical protein VTK73DRAFT_6889 [Phialemonium thermophilum]|uniref:Secreted protein n=1 Tax=Phialemonium thermophilum TaxID=223376 RepID=A0ABR3WHY7_9PEZI
MARGYTGWRVFLCVVLSSPFRSRSSCFVVLWFLRYGVSSAARTAVCRFPPCCCRLCIQVLLRFRSCRRRVFVSALVLQRASWLDRGGRRLWKRRRKERVGRKQGVCSIMHLASWRPGLFYFDRWRWASGTEVDKILQRQIGTQWRGRNRAVFFFFFCSVEFSGSLPLLLPLIIFNPLFVFLSSCCWPSTSHFSYADQGLGMCLFTDVR